MWDEVLDGSQPRVMPLDAWRLVIGTTVKPVVVVDDEAPDYLSRVDTAWREVAEREGLFGTSASFWIHVAGPGASRQPWRKVRTTGGLGPARHLTDESGEPEFLAMSFDERVICGVTTEEDGVWIVVARLDSQTD